MGRDRKGLDEYPTERTRVSQDPTDQARVGEYPTERAREVAPREFRRVDEELVRIVPAAISVAAGGVVIGSLVPIAGAPLVGAIVGALLGAATGHRLFRFELHRKGIG